MSLSTHKAGSLLKDSACLLKKIPFEDKDHIVTLLTKNNGLMVARTRSSKTSRKRFGAYFDYFNDLTIHFKTTTRTFQQLSHVELISSYQSWKKNYNLFQHLTLVMRFISDMMAEETQEELGEVYHLYIQALRLSDLYEDKLKSLNRVQTYTLLILNILVQKMGYGNFFSFLDSHYKQGGTSFQSISRFFEENDDQKYVDFLETYCKSSFELDNLALDHFFNRWKEMTMIDWKYYKECHLQNFSIV